MSEFTERRAQIVREAEAIKGESKELPKLLERERFIKRQERRKREREEYTGD